MGFNGVMVTAKNFVTIFAAYGKPIFLFTCLESAMFSNVLIVHFEISLED